MCFEVSYKTLHKMVHHSMVRESKRVYLRTTELGIRTTRMNIILVVDTFDSIAHTIFMYIGLTTRPCTILILESCYIFIILQEEIFEVSNELQELFLLLRRRERMIEQTIQLHNNVLGIGTFKFSSCTAYHAECNEQEQVVERGILIIQEHLFQIRETAKRYRRITKSELSELIRSSLHDIAVLRRIEERFYDAIRFIRNRPNSIKDIVGIIQLLIELFELDQILLLIGISLCFDVFIQLSNTFSTLFLELRIILCFHNILSHDILLRDKRTNGLIHTHEFTIRVMDLSYYMAQICAIAFEFILVFVSSIVYFHLIVKIRLFSIHSFTIRIEHRQRLLLRKRCNMQLSHTADQIAGVFFYSILHLKNRVGHLFCRLQRFY